MASFVLSPISRLAIKSDDVLDSAADLEKADVLDQLNAEVLQWKAGYTSVRAASVKAIPDSQFSLATFAPMSARHGMLRSDSIVSETISHCSPFTETPLTRLTALAPRSGFPSISESSFGRNWCGVAIM